MTVQADPVFTQGVHALGHALEVALSMGWEILWALILGFALSGAVQAVVSKRRLTQLLPDDSARSVTVASLLGAASSSCSYAAVALARTLVVKGANFTAAMAFMFGSTNLVIELGLLMWLLLGWQFTLAEFTGGPFMIVLLVLLFRASIRPAVIAGARRIAERGRRGRMEAHAGMDMAVDSSAGTMWTRLRSNAGRTATAHYFVMDWQSLWIDIVGGLLIAGALAAWVPKSFWQAFFFSAHPLIAGIWGPLVGPIVAVLSFVCSIGNVPLAAVLWNGGISFGGVVAFLFADLIVLPILDIYRKYYGWRMSWLLFITFYIAMAIAGYAVELVFGVLGLIPSERRASVLEAHISLNYTTVLNIIFLLLAVALVIRFFRTGGREMLAMMRD